MRRRFGLTYKAVEQATSIRNRTTSSRVLLHNYAFALSVLGDGLLLVYVEGARRLPFVGLSVFRLVDRARWHVNREGARAGKHHIRSHTDKVTT